MEARVDIYDSIGRFVNSYVTDLHAHGSRTDLFKWDLSNSGGSRVEAGIYTFKIELTTINGASTQYGSKLIVVKP